MRSILTVVIATTLCSCTNSGEADGTLATLNGANGTMRRDVREDLPPSGPASVTSKDTDVQQVSACFTQDGAALKLGSIEALGTEPFWSIRTDGRCVTYSTPEDQAGTRVWTKVSGGGQDWVWTGSLRGKLFELTVKPKADCSDGMSDRVYPLEAVLRVDGEVRNGCAAPVED
jgi:uncharacterized membrane protein